MTRRRLDCASFPWGPFVLAGGLLLPGSPHRATAAPVVGFVESFSTAGSLGGFGGGGNESNPGADGVGGAADGFLRVATVDFAGRLGTNNVGSAYAGDWIAAGVRYVQFSLRDVDADQALEIRFCIGNTNNFWQSNVGIDPPSGSWGTYAVDLTDSTSFTQIIAFGPGGFARALQETDRILIRHDRAPFVQTPDVILGDFGLDEIKLLADPPVPARPSTWGALKGLYR